MIGYFILIILASVIFGCGVTMWFLVQTIAISNQFSNSKGDFYKNTKQPMRIREYSIAEQYKDMQENPDQYGVIKI